MSLQQSTNPSTPSSIFFSWLWIINTVKVRMAVDAWLDTQCGVPEITVSPNECSCEDAQRFTGCFNVKFRVQSRMATLHHLDAWYIATQYQYLKQFVVLNQNDTIMICMDDKAVVPVGDPGMPLSTGVRPHNRVLAPTEGPELVAMDHDFCINGLVPYF